MKLKTILVTTLMAGLIIGSLVGCNAAKDGDTAQRETEKKIVVGTDPEFPPFEYQDKEGIIGGFDVDLMNAIGKDQGFEVTFTSLEFDSLTGALATGQIDAAAAGISITPERNEQVLFSEPYMNASLGIVVPKENTDIKSAEDLKGKVICAQLGTTGAEAATKLKEDGIVKEVKLLANFSVCIQELETGGSDACVNDMPVNLNYIATYPDKIRVLDDPYATDYYAITISKENKELQAKINAGLKNIIANGEYEALCKKYNLPVSPDLLKGEVTVEKILGMKSKS